MLDELMLFACRKDVLKINAIYFESLCLTMQMNIASNRLVSEPALGISCVPLSNYGDQ
jgi:hypothetical protein